MELTQDSIDALLSGAPDPLDAPAESAGLGPVSAEVSRVLSLELLLSVVLAERDLPIEQVLAMTAGTIIEFDVPFDTELNLRVGEQTIARGQAVKIGENFGLRVLRIEDTKERIRAMGG